MKIEKIALLTDYHSKKSGKTALFYVFIYNYYFYNCAKASFKSLIQ